MIQRHRISTDIGKEQKITIELNQDYDLLEILSLKFTQKDIYRSLCSDYGVVIGRISVNNGLGVPNAKVSIFVPLSSDDENDPVISALYPYKSTTDKNDQNYRYNLLPAAKQFSGHAPTGTFPDQEDILRREEVLEVYEKYYSYTVKTNDAGDFMIWGVPIGSQTLHVDVDLSDIGCFSLRPYDFIRQGAGVDAFKNKYSFKSSSDLNSLPQIKSFDKTIEVYPFWGNKDLCEIGITRTDFDLSSVGVKIEPKAFLIGGTFTDTGKNSINKNCQPRKKMGRKCDLTTKAGKIEGLRYTTNLDDNNRPIIEQYDLNEDIEEDGAFVLPIPMNMDYLYTNEFGENLYTNDSNKGVATSACYRLRLSMKDEGLARVRAIANYLVPNIREYSGDTDASYSFSTSYDDYPTHAVENYMLNSQDGFYYPQDYFYRYEYNKVYTVSQFHGSYFKDVFLAKDRFVGIKELVPSEEEDCSSNVVNPPVNFGFKNYTFLLLVTDVLLFFEHIVNLVTLTFFNTVAKVLHALANAVDFWPIKRLSKVIRTFAYRVQEAGQRNLYLINYPECEECSGNNEYGTTLQGDPLDYCEVGTITIYGNTTESPRTVIVNNTSIVSNIPDPKCVTNGARAIANFADFYSNQSSYFLYYNESAIILDSPTNITFDGVNYVLNDLDSVFNETKTYTTVSIRDRTVTADPLPPKPSIEEGCDIYNIPYDESIVSLYYTSDTDPRTSTTGYTPGMVVYATNLTLIDQYKLETSYYGTYFTVNTKSGFSEFSRGVFYIIPGTQTNRRLFKILKEFRRRKRVGQMFCGGIVNYSFIDNWLSGSLYFFQFKVKHIASQIESKIKYCRDVVRYVQGQNKFYYRSTLFNSVLNTYGDSFPNNTSPYRRLGHPTTIVNLGPRDEFIKEICTDPAMDPNCSISRFIGPTSFQNFGEILGLAINYRMDVSNTNFSLNDFFTNGGFDAIGAKNVLDGDILQLVSINNETGIEEFDLNTRSYAGYSYQVLDPEIYPSVFMKNGVYGPTPITLDLNENGEKIRLCLNNPGALTESSQQVPFYLWDKKGTGFGPYDLDKLDDQSWDYKKVELQPLQGMTYGYKFTGTYDNPSDKYLLLPITYDFSGQTFSGINGVTGLTVEYNIVSTIDNHSDYNNSYPGFTFLYVTSGTEELPLTGTLYTRYGPAGNDGVIGWDILSWNNGMDFIIKKTQDYYISNTQILGTPFLFYFGLRPGKTGLDKFTDLFGPKGAFTLIQ